jgi:hypothetical protein
MEMLAQSHMLDDAHHELELPTTGILPDGLNNFRPLSASAGDPPCWMPSPTRSLNGTTFSAMGDNLQDPFPTSNWRVSTPFSHKARRGRARHHIENSVCRAKADLRIYVEHLWAVISPAYLFIPTL